MTKGWIWLYVIGSIPLLLVYAVGLSGWFFEYPVGLIVALFAVFAAPLVVAACDMPNARHWNITMQWAALGLVILRSLNLLIGPGSADELPTNGLVAIAVVVAAGFAWASAWTKYFRTAG